MIRRPKEEVWGLPYDLENPEENAFISDAAHLQRAWIKPIKFGEWRSSRRAEWWAVRKALISAADLFRQKHDQWPISWSLSHSEGIAVAMVSADFVCGMDYQKNDIRLKAGLKRISQNDKVLSPMIDGFSEDELGFFWTAKEGAFKCFFKQDKCFMHELRLKEYDQESRYALWFVERTALWVETQSYPAFEGFITTAHYVPRGTLSF